MRRRQRREEGSRRGGEGEEERGKEAKQVNEDRMCGMTGDTGAAAAPLKSRGHYAYKEDILLEEMKQKQRPHEEVENCTERKIQGEI